MHEHVSKRVKMHIKPTGGTNKHSKHVITHRGKGKGTHGATRHPKTPPKWLHPKQGLMDVGCNHTTTNPLRASNMGKPSTREANTSIKHRSKQA